MDREQDSSSNRRTSAWVRWSDTLAEGVITAGGLGVLAAMLGICVFLFAVAGPLFNSGEVTQSVTQDTGGDFPAPLATGISPDRRWYAVTEPTGRSSLIEIETGSVAAQAQLLEFASPVSAGVYEAATGWLFLGHEDGKVSTGQLSLQTGLLSEADLPDGLRAMELGAARGVSEAELAALDRSSSIRFEPSGCTVFERLEDGGRVTSVLASAGRPAQLPVGSGPVARISGTASNERQNYVFAVRESGESAVGLIRVRRSLGGGPARTQLSWTPVTQEPGPLPEWVMIDADGLHALSVFASGSVSHAARASSRADAFEQLETIRAVEAGRSITAATTALGARSLLVGDSEGRLSSWTIGAAAEDNLSKLTLASQTISSGGPIVALSTSIIDRTVLKLDETGQASIHNMTSLRQIAALPGTVSPGAHPTLGADLDAAVALTPDGMLHAWELDPAYPEVGWRTLAKPIRYEGYSKPEWVYQSTGSPVAETKLSLVPLIWGTLKATIVSMIIAAPLAVLAAIYTSEFLQPQIRKVVKPVIELMASLPSVVLGFIAAMVVAPYLRDYLSEILTALLALPIGLLIGATMVRFIPTRMSHRLTSGLQLTMISLALLFATGVAIVLGKPLEATLFPATETNNAGIIPWLNSRTGSATPGWLLFTVPVAMLLLFVLWSKYAGRSWGEWISTRTQTHGAAAELGRVLVLLVLGLGLGAVIAFALAQGGIDPRDSIVGTYSQRNTLVVGFVMGFAVIPIIYTISEDALRAVPSGLRSASLGTGATRWQTAVRVVLPVAGSGIFSACMVGLGRAVGETMIVLMATGNTPEMTANIFSGFRTLAANIAVELPEAPRGGGHYRVLFMCGLVLFVMTLVINTTAEIVRQRVRKKNAAL